MNHLGFFWFNAEFRLDLHQDTEKNVITAIFEFPGFSKDELQLDFQNGKLTVSAETKQSEQHADAGYTLRERLHGKFSRTLQLPQGVRVCFFLYTFEWMSTDVFDYTGWADQSDDGRWSFDRHFSKDIAWTRTKEDRHLRAMKSYRLWTPQL